MELLIRGAVIYLLLLVLLRASGNRQFSQLEAFDIVVLILIAETASQALVGEDHSLTAAIVVITTIVALDIGLSLLKRQWKRADDYLDGVPILLVDDGRLLDKHLHRERVDRGDILAAARAAHGIEHFAEIKYALLERDGKISIVPRA